MAKRCHAAAFRDEYLAFNANNTQCEIDSAKVEDLLACVQDDFEDPELTAELNRFSDIMADPALLSLLRRSDDRIFAEKESNRVRKQGAHVVGIRPQAKHVRSDRVLSKEDEEEIRQLQEKADGAGQYLNPLVPKRREYLAQQQQQQEQQKRQQQQHQHSEGSQQSEQARQNHEQSTMERLLHPESSRQQDFGDDDEDDEDEEDGDGYQEENEEEDDDNDDDEEEEEQEQEQETTEEGDERKEDENEDEDEDQTDLDENPTADAVLKQLLHPSIPSTSKTLLFADVLKKRNESVLKTVCGAWSYKQPRRLQRPLTYVRHRKLPDKKEAGPKPSRHPTLLEAPEAMIVVAVYRPNPSNSQYQEFVLLGSHTLADVRDMIKCAQDFANHHAHAGRKPENPVLNTQTQKRTGSCFFIEDAFYVDTRAEQEGLGEEPDYSAAIREWAANRGTSYRRVPTLDVKFDDLDLHLNQHYLFTHQENCDHYMVIRDIRMPHVSDEQDKSAYPLKTVTYHSSRHRCTFCNVFPASTKTFNDLMAGITPAYFCKQCFERFHFDEQGGSVFEFTAVQHLE
ncbi:snRNA-activating protein of 50kDa MW C terminal-domain-containing protein [Syncephalastrum racemosum]|uniref:snRNA-activating protein of 50kDa MW C terminal-domain-containing protein n=1 Tax=Syncephalastrum racemosum TaxID=13706 RepID=A0A1X2HL13_SYNRA|nr:snRNA-activating protein of 50kDa MW C terminal-domain-containing protein [Syncephalastrum racemosum]